MTSRLICVLGMHRSGTSAFAGTLRHLGVELGSNLVPAKLGVNDRGFWEHDDVVDLHQRLLDALESSWDDPRPLPEDWWLGSAARPFRDEITALMRRDFMGTALGGLKDPRLCRLLPLWLDVFRECHVAPHFAIIFRHPVEVARSLERRDAFVPEKSLLLWLDHNLAAEAFSRGFPRVFVGFDHFLAEPEAVIGRVAHRMDCLWPNPLAAAMPEISRFLAPQLRHNAIGEVTDGSVGIRDSLLADAYDALREAERGETPQLIHVFDDLRRRSLARLASFDPALIGHIRDMQRRQSRLKWRLQAIGASASWRMTRPIRGVERLVDVLFRRDKEKV